MSIGYFHLSGYSGCKNGPIWHLKPSSTPHCSPSCSTRWRKNQYYNAIVWHVFICRAETAVPVALCSPWSQSHPWADKWCRSCPCTEKERRAGAWSSYCKLQWEKEGLVRVRCDNQVCFVLLRVRGQVLLAAAKMHSASGAQWFLLHLTFFSFLLEVPDLQRPSMDITYKTESCSSPLRCYVSHGSTVR